MKTLFTFLFLSLCYCSSSHAQDYSIQQQNKRRVTGYIQIGANFHEVTIITYTSQNGEIAESYSIYNDGSLPPQFPTFGSLGTRIYPLNPNNVMATTYNLTHYTQHSGLGTIYIFM